MILKGRTHKYGANVDTDVIIPARYLNVTDPTELAKHCLEDLDAEFIKKVKPGDFIIADMNFGCGSSREHAPIAIKAAGVSCVVAKSFARIFYRNAINIGLPIVESVEAVEGSESGDELECDLTRGLLKNITRNQEYPIAAFPDSIQEIIASGGLIASVRQRLGIDS